MLFDNDRLSHWLAGTLFTWVMMFLLYGLPVFHFWLNVSVEKIATFTGVCCAVQLAVTPWLFHARATPESPRGRIVERAAALSVLFSAMMLLFFYYLRRSSPEDIETRRFTTIALIGTIPLVVLGFIVVVWRYRNGKRSTPV